MASHVPVSTQRCAVTGPGEGITFQVALPHSVESWTCPATKILTIGDDDIKIICVSVDFSLCVRRSVNRPVFHLARPGFAAAMTKHVCPSLEPAATKTLLLHYSDSSDDENEFPKQKTNKLRFSNGIDAIMA